MILRVFVLLFQLPHNLPREVNFGAMFSSPTGEDDLYIYGGSVAHNQYLKLTSFAGQWIPAGDQFLSKTMSLVCSVQVIN